MQSKEEDRGEGNVKSYARLESRIWTQDWLAVARRACTLETHLQTSQPLSGQSVRTWENS